MSLHLLPIYASLTCGGCGKAFEGNVRSVPVLKACPACPSCWRRLNDLRQQLDLPEWETPADAYPPPAQPA